MKKPATQSNAKKEAPKPSTSADKISQQEYDSLKETFDLFDEDGSGTIEPVQLHKVMEELGLTRRNPTVTDIINDLKDVGKPINFNQFLDVVVGRVGETKTRDGLAKVYALYDKDGSGFLDLAKFKTIARELGETMNDEELIELMHNAYILNNTESNESYSFDDFYTIVTKKRN